MTLNDLEQSKFYGRNVQFMLVSLTYLFRFQRASPFSEKVEANLRSQS